MKKVCNNGYKSYIRSRPGASKDSVRRAKSINVDQLQVHPIFSEKYGSETDRLKFINKMKDYKPQTVSKNRLQTLTTQFQTQWKKLIFSRPSSS